MRVKASTSALSMPGAALVGAIVHSGCMVAGSVRPVRR